MLQEIKIPQDITHIGTDFLGIKITSPIASEYIPRLENVLSRKEGQFPVKDKTIYLILAAPKDHRKPETSDSVQKSFSSFKPLSNTQERSFENFMNQRYAEAKSFVMGHVTEKGMIGIEDIVQTAFMKIATLWNNRYELASPNELKALLFETLKTTIKNSFRDNSRYYRAIDTYNQLSSSSLIIDDDELFFNKQSGVESCELNKILENISNLPDHRKMVAVLRLSNLGHFDIGEILGVDGWAIKQFWIRFTTRVKKELNSPTF